MRVNVSEDLFRMAGNQNLEELGEVTAKNRVELLISVDE
jgi:hypothetical protein